MSPVSLQFEGVANSGLLAGLGVAVGLALLAHGLWRLIRGQARLPAAVSMAGGLLTICCVVIAALRVGVDSSAGRLLWLGLLAAVVVLAIAVFYSAVYAYLGRRRISVLLALRFLAIISLLLILFKPAVSVQPTIDQAKPVLSVLVDRSASMGTLDYSDLPSRYRQSVEALAGQRKKLADNFRVQFMHFAAKPQAVDGVDDLAALEPSGPGTDGTDIAAALKAAAQENDQAAVILISDGIQNADGSALDAARVSRAPIYAIGAGSETESAAGGRNVRLLAVEAPLEAVRNNVTTLTAKIKLTGWANIPAKVTLSEGGTEIASQQVLTDANNQIVPVKFNWTPQDTGGATTKTNAGETPTGKLSATQGPDIRKLTVAVLPNPAETTAEDNAAALHVLVTQPSIRVLYVEGTLRPEYKYLRRILDTDPNVKFMALARISESRFLAQGNIDGKSLTDLPRTDAEFGFFDVIIIGDLDRTFLTNDQLEKLRQFVNDGKALLMLGGRNSFGSGGYGGTAIEAALPVTCGPRNVGQETTPFVPQLTAAGAASPIFAGLEKHFGSTAGKAIDPLPELLGCAVAVSAKPTASVLAVHPTRGNENGPLVVLAVQQFGKGRCAAFTADTTWQWYLKLKPSGGDNPYHRFWGQLIRYLAGMEKKQKQQSSAVLARLESQYIQQGESLKVTALVKDAEGVSAGEATVSAEVAPEGAAVSPGGAGGADSGGKAISGPLAVTLQKSQGGAGLYEGSLAVAKGGHYVLTVKATDKAGATLGSDQLPVIVAGRSKETDKLARDTAALRAIAAAPSGTYGREGRYAELSALPDVVDQIIQHQQARLTAPPPAQKYDLYNFTLLFLVFVGLLTTEWWLRRSWQLQ